MDFDNIPEEKIIGLGLRNYYGGVFAVKENEKYYLCLNDHSDTKYIEISEEFYAAIEKEFKKD